VLDVDVDEAEVVVLEFTGALLGRGDRRGRQAAQALGLEDAIDAVPVQVRQEVAQGKGEVIEREAGGAADGTDDGPFLVAGPPA
jgi:hypothetical protein